MESKIDSDSGLAANPLNYRVIRGAWKLRGEASHFIYISLRAHNISLRAHNMANIAFKRLGRDLRDLEANPLACVSAEPLGKSRT